MNEYLKVERALVLFDFQKQSRMTSLLLHLKYHGHKDIVLLLRNYLVPKLHTSLLFVEVKAILPTPHHLKRLKKTVL